MCRPNIITKGAALPQQQRNRSSAWLKRSLATRTVSFVNAEVDNLLGNCRFLQQHEAGIEEEEQDNGKLARFRRREIQIGSFLGQGGFSEVHQVASFEIDDDDDDSSESSDHDDNESLRHRLQQSTVDTRTGEYRYVIKHLKKDIMTNRTRFHQAAADLLLEAKFLTHFDHPNIIKLRALATGDTSAFGDGQHDGYFLILDHIDMDLSHRIQQWKEEEQLVFETSITATAAVVPTTTTTTTGMRHYFEKLDYGKQIASALDYLHQRDIMYRDLKPDNVGIKNGIVQLFDFGLCRELPEVKPHPDKLFHMSGCGTRRYMSPEVALGEAYNLKTDVYSLAVVLYEMMSLEKPYELYNREVHQFLVCEGKYRPEMNAKWPQDLQDLLGAGWTHEPSQRPSMNEMFLKLGKLADRAIPEKPTLSSSNTTTSALQTTGRAIFQFVKGWRKTSQTDLTSTTVLSNTCFDSTPAIKCNE